MSAQAPSTDRRTRASVLAIQCVIAADAATFVALLVGALMTRASEPWSVGVGVADAALLTGLLAGCSVALAVSRGRRAWLAAAAILGAIFCVVTGLEWRALVAGGQRLGSSIATDWLYAVTAYHAAHVAVGVFAIAAVLRRPLSPRVTRVLSWYWHFVDLLWLTIAATFYL